MGWGERGAGAVGGGGKKKAVREGGGHKPSPGNNERGGS